jgi:hypothetical protein
MIEISQLMRVPRRTCDLLGAELILSGLTASHDTFNRETRVSQDPVFSHSQIQPNTNKEEVVCPKQVR